MLRAQTALGRSPIPLPGNTTSARRREKVRSFTCRLTVVFEDLTENKFIGVLAERVPKHGSRSQVHVTVGAFGLVGAGAIEIPLREIWSKERNQPQ